MGCWPRWGQGSASPAPVSFAHRSPHPACLCVHGHQGGVWWWFALQGHPAREGRGQCPSPLPWLRGGDMQGGRAPCSPSASGDAPGQRFPWQLRLGFWSQHPSCPENLLLPGAFSLSFSPATCQAWGCATDGPAASWQAPLAHLPGTEHGGYLQQIFLLEIRGFGEINSARLSNCTVSLRLC